MLGSMVFKLLGSEEGAKGVCGFDMEFASANSCGRWLRLAEYLTNNIATGHRAVKEDASGCRSKRALGALTAFFKDWDRCGSLGWPGCL